MKRFKRLGAISVVAMSLLFTGCGTGVVNLTAHEEDMIVTYISGAVSKANINHPQGLTYLSDTDKEEMKEALSGETQEEKTSEETSEEIQGEALKQPTTSKIENSSENTEVVTSNLTEVLSIPSITAEYKNYSIHKNYMEGDYFALSAKSGSTYLVLNLALTNTSQEEVTCNILEKDIKAAIFVNGQKAADAMPTILLHDFSTYIENIAPSSTKDAILIFEVKEDAVEDVQTLEMEVQMDDTTYRIALE